MAKSGMNFKSGANYKKWLAYGHMHGDFAKSPGNTPVSIKGKSKQITHNEVVSRLQQRSRAKK